MDECDFKGVFERAPREVLVDTPESILSLMAEQGFDSEIIGMLERAIRASKETVSGLLDGKVIPEDAAFSIAKRTMMDESSLLGIFEGMAPRPESADPAAGPDKVLFKDEYGNSFSTSDVSAALTWLHESADSDDPVAMTLLGQLYSNGTFFDKSAEKAVEIFEKAAEGGYAEAQFHLGSMYNSGRGVTRSTSKAMGWYSKAAEQGHTESKFVLGMIYLKDLEYEKAAELIGEAALEGIPIAQLMLGRLYMYGLGVEKSESKAIHWVTRSAEQGDEMAKVYLQDIRSSDWSKRHLEDMEESFRFLAENDRAVCQSTMAESYLEEDEPGSDEDAARLYRYSAERGHPEAQYNLGVMYMNGRGVEKDLEEAARWFRKAADQGLAISQYNLGVFCFEGTGVEQSYRDAISWFRLAAAQGYALAQRNLGVMYENGYGFKKSRARARKWYMKAAENGCE